jgi:hypothetical protein
MRVHLILDLTPDGTRRSREAVTDELEATLEANPIEVDGTVYEVSVLGVGATAKEADESAKLRRAGKMQ